jgi:hypothetical protein
MGLPLWRTKNIIDPCRDIRFVARGLLRTVWTQKNPPNLSDAQGAGWLRMRV